jgi:hypothetical protein
VKNKKQKHGQGFQQEDVSLRPDKQAGQTAKVTAFLYILSSFLIRHISWQKLSYITEILNTLIFALKLLKSRRKMCPQMYIKDG